MLLAALTCAGGMVEGRTPAIDPVFADPEGTRVVIAGALRSQAGGGGVPPVASAPYTLSGPYSGGGAGFSLCVSISRLTPSEFTVCRSEPLASHLRG
jgi:hypothetical protein